MNRQIYGITLFVAIVSFSVFAYEYFSYSKVPDCASAMNEKCAKPPEPYVLKESDYATEYVSVRLENVVAGMHDETVKTRMKLEWQGRGEVPSAVWAPVQLRDLNGSSVAWTKPVRIVRPFEGYNVRVTEPEFECDRCHDLPRNLYATVKVWTWEKNAERNSSFEVKKMTPVLVQE